MEADTACSLRTDDSSNNLRSGKSDKIPILRKTEMTTCTIKWSPYIYNGVQFKSKLQYTGRRSAAV